MFTELELKVLRELHKSSEGNGHDFGFTEDARGACDRKQLSGVVSSLVQKRIITVDEITTDSGTWHQFDWADGARAKVEAALA